MSRSGVTKEDVAVAMSELEAAGETLSVRKVRQHLQRGSFSTISKHMALVRVEKQVIVLEDDIPEDLMEQFMSFLKLAWRASQDTANQKNRQLKLDLYEKTYEFSEALEKMQEAINQAAHHVKLLDEIGQVKLK